MTSMFFYAYAFFTGFYLCAGATLMKTENVISFLIFRLFPLLLGFPMFVWAIAGLIGAFP